MAEILKARDLSRPEHPIVAVKRILPHLTDDPQYVTMFLDESRVLARLEHANVIRTLDVGQVGPTPYIALEYVHGHDARMVFHRARRDGVQVPLRIACYLMAQVCAGLQFAHDQVDEHGESLGIVHRDVSLQNVLISYDGEVKLIDFGIAMSSRNQARTEVGIVKGKFGYMSPEQVRGEPLDRRSDVFAAGICLYELLTSERLFGGDSDYAAVERVRNAIVEPPSRWNRLIPSALEAIVLDALAKQPEQRFASAAELRKALLGFMADSGNECSAAELSDYMRRVFAEDLRRQPSPETIVKPAARDALTGLAAFEDLDPVSALTMFDAPPEPQQPQHKPKPARTSPASVPPTVPRPSSVPPEAESGPVGQVSAPVDMDWDEEEPITQHESAEGLAALPESFADDDLTQQLQVGATFSGVHPRDSGVLPAQLRARPMSELDAASDAAFEESSAGVPSPFDSQGSSGPSLPPPSALVAAVAPLPQPSEAPRSMPGPSARASYGAVIAVVATIVAVISVGLLATRGARPAAIHLSTLPIDAEVHIDGQRVRPERSPFVIGDLEPEVLHELKVGREGYQGWSTTLTLQPSQVLKLPRVELVPQAQPSTEPRHQAPSAPAKAPKAGGPDDDDDDAVDNRTRKARAERSSKASKTSKKPSPQKKASSPPRTKPSAPAASAGGGVGILRLNSRPWSQVVVDGRSVGNTPQMNLSLSAGTHTISLVNPQFGLRKTLKVKISAGQVLTKIIDLQ